MKKLFHVEKEVTVTKEFFVFAENKQEADEIAQDLFEDDVPLSRLDCLPNDVSTISNEVKPDSFFNTYKDYIDNTGDLGEGDEALENCRTVADYCKVAKELQAEKQKAEAAQKWEEEHQEKLF